MLYNDVADDNLFLLYTLKILKILVDNLISYFTLILNMWTVKQYRSKSFTNSFNYLNLNTILVNKFSLVVNSNRVFLSSFQSFSSLRRQNQKGR